MPRRLPWGRTASKLQIVLAAILVPTAFVACVLPWWKHHDRVLWAQLNEQSNTLFSAGRFVEMEPVAKRVAALALHSPWLKTERIVSVYNLASIYNLQARYAEAEPVYRKSYELSQKLLAENDGDRILPIQGLAHLYYDQGRYAEAEPLLQQAAGLSERVYGPDHPYVASALTLLSYIRLHDGRYAASQAMVERALTIRVKQIHNDPDPVGVALDDLAEIYGRLDRPGVAEALRRRALALRVQAHGTRHRDVAYTMERLAGLWMNTPVPKSHDHRMAMMPALLLLRQDYAITSRHLGPGHPDAARALNALAEIQQRMYHPLRAEQLYREAILIAIANQGPKHHLVGRPLAGLASLYKDAHRYAEAQMAALQAIDVYESTFGPDTDYILTSLRILGRIANEQLQLKDALAYYTRALAIADKTRPPGDSQLASLRREFTELQERIRAGETPPQKTGTGQHTGAASQDAAASLQALPLAMLSSHP